MPGWTQPATWTDLQVPTAAVLNAQVRDNLAWLAGDAVNPKPSARVFNSTGASITSSLETALTFDTERFNVGPMHSTVTNPNRLTVPAGGAGKYLIGAMVAFVPNATGGRQVAIRVNGTTYIAVVTQGVVTSTLQARQIATCLYQLAVGDYVEALVTQISGAPLAIEAFAAFTPEFFAIWMGL